MAKPRKLKVFRTPIGFHDAYVAAPSQKAALEAWGSDSNLFAAGAAEQVTDPELVKEPLERPGEVVRRLRATADEQVEALGAKKSKKKDSGPGAKQSRGAAKTASAKRTKRAPRPSRAPVDRAEKALDEAERRHRSALAELRREEQALERRRRDLERKQRDERERLERAVDEARQRYRSAMEEWAD